MKPSIFTIPLLLAACTDHMPGMPGDDDPQPVRATTRVKISNITTATALASGAANMKVDGTMGPAGPGGAWEVKFRAGRGQYINFVSMFGESNDWFFAPDTGGISLYDEQGYPVQGDVTNKVYLWDAGTEIDQEPGVGPDTGPNQLSPTQGAADPNNLVRGLDEAITLSNGTTFARPKISDMIKVTLSAEFDGMFTLRIENVSTTTTLHTSLGDRAIHLSPPVWAQHMAYQPDPFFGWNNVPDRGVGLEDLAESGNNARLTAHIARFTGEPTPISPGVWALSSTGEPLFSLGQPDRNIGLEQLAEDGDNGPLGRAMTNLAERGTVSGTGVFELTSQHVVKTPAFPTEDYTFDIVSSPGDSFSFATMFGFSNDWFFAGPAAGFPLWDGDTQLSANYSDRVHVYDLGTEVDEPLALGPDTGPQQVYAGEGALDPNPLVRLAPISAEPYVQLTIEALGPQE